MESNSDTLEITRLGFTSQFIFLSDSLIEAISKRTSRFTIELETALFQLDEVVITPGVQPLHVVSEIDLNSSPVKSSQEILRKVPGLVIGQHAGGGKAEQIFLRGFDIDHGTDINITVDGMPVNMVSHAHGQGYADLHFIIPETIENIDYGKGPYYADQGNFATAGYIHFQTKKRLSANQIQLEAGQFNTMRTLAMINLINSKKQSAYIATSYLKTDGPVESPQNFHRLNVMAKYNLQLENEDQLSFSASHFNSEWDASGQIPQRAVDAGMISRFGAIDDTEGGNTSRTNLSLQYLKYINSKSFIKNNFYHTLYNFELYSNFTFLLNDPINGDQIRQKEDRNIFGFQSEYNRVFDFTNLSAGAEVETLLQIGTGLRSDRVEDVELSRTANRSTTLSRIQLGDVNETNLFSYINARMEIGKWSINPGLRLDYFDFKYQDALSLTYSNESLQKAVISPKLNFAFQYSPKLQFYLKSGIGFHSNDSRVVISPDTKVEEVLPAAFGSDLGLVWKVAPKLLINSALWYLRSQQEFVYVGDEGIVEPSGKSKRLGVDFGLRFQLAKQLFYYTDINYAYARSLDEVESNNRIPLAPDLTITGGLDGQIGNRWSGGIRYRYLKTRPANEDNSIQAKGYFITDFNLNYQMKKIRLGFVIENLFNTQWNETQFATNSRLAGEDEAVEEIHFTPGTPFFLKGTVSYIF